MSEENPSGPNLGSEIAKAAKSAIDGTRELGGFLKDVFGEGFLELGGSFSDAVKHYRWKNLIKIFDEAERIVETRKLEGKATPIPPRIAVDLIEKASKEDNQSLQKMWAALIVNLGDPASGVSPERKYVDILAALDPLDAKVLNYMGGQNWASSPAHFVNEMTLTKLIEVVGADERATKVALENLFRLGCVADVASETYASIDETKSGLRWGHPSAKFYITVLGYNLLKACKA